MMNKAQNIHEISIKAIRESSPLVDYTDGDIAIIDNVRQLSELNPIKANLNFIIVCYKGRIQLDVNGCRRQLEKNDVLFSCPGVVLDNYMISPDFECKMLCLSERVIHNLLHEHVDTWNRAVYVRRMNVISLSDDYVSQYSLYHALFQQNLRMPERHFAKNAMQALIQALLFDLCSILHEYESDSGGSRQSQGKLLFDRFLTMLANEKVKRRPVGHYASRLAITPKYLTMVCEQHSGKPAKDWINQYVVEDVRYYLRNTTVSIKEVSDILGFANISHFGSYVRHHFGMSPSVFRASED